MSPPHLLTLRQEHTGPITGRLKCLWRLGQVQEQICWCVQLCWKLLEPCGRRVVRFNSQSLRVSADWTPSDTLIVCSVTILIGGVLVNQMGGSDDGLHSILSFPVFM